MLQVSKTTVNEPAGGCGGAAADVILLDQGNGQPSQGGIPGDSGPVDTRADNREVETEVPWPPICDHG